jgi:ATP-binding cassette subfamily B protein/subfamily B ATP-binding cassette protein MsbA
MKTLLPRLLAYLRPHRFTVLNLLCLVVLMTGMELLKPWPIQFIIDRILGAGPVPVADPLYALVLASFSIVIIALLSATFLLLHNYVGVRLGQDLVHELRGTLYQHLQRLSLAFHARQTIGDLMYRVTADTYAIQTITMNALLPLFSATGMLLGMALIMFSMDPVLTMLALIVCPILFAVMSILNSRIAHAGLQARHTESNLYTLVQRVLSSIHLIQAFAAEERERQAFLSASEQGLAARLRLYTLQTFYSGTVNLVIAVGTATVIGVGAAHVLTGTLTVGQLVVFMAYLASLYAPINSIVQSNGLIQEAKAGVQRVFHMLDVVVEPSDGTACLIQCRGHIVFQHISFGYRPLEPVLHDISLEVQPGETVAIVGSTGAGKSTLVSLIPRFYDPLSGRILLDGRDLRDYRLADLRKHISLVLQPPLLFPVSIRENIAYGQPDASMADIRAAARLAGIDRRIEELREGYETVLGDRLSLSEGERQRLTIARALLRDAPILILDEPTSSVDVETEGLIMESLQQLKARRTCFIIAHRMSTIREADHIVVLDRGRIIQIGSHNDLIAQVGRYANLYNLQGASAHELSSPSS